MSRKRNIRLAVLIFIAIAIALFLPGLGIAGSLEPSGPPGPTMKTLDQIPPTWSQQLQCDTTACPRFELVLGGEAVLDKETGLVWEKTLMTLSVEWDIAQVLCVNMGVGNREGWHLPTVQELESLIDNPFPLTGNQLLPSGHPFVNVQSGAYWSATTFASDTSEAWLVSMYESIGRGNVGPDYKTQGHYVWCVRGGQGVDPQ